MGSGDKRLEILLTWGAPGPSGKNRPTDHGTEGAGRKAHDIRAMVRLFT